MGIDVLRCLERQGAGLSESRASISTPGPSARTVVHPGTSDQPEVSDEIVAGGVATTSPRHFGRRGLSGAWPSSVISDSGGLLTLVTRAAIA